MRRDDYLTQLRQDGRRLLRAASADLQLPVPSCPGWTIDDVLAHTAEVYEHKIACIRLAGARPDPWPPDRPEGDVRSWFADAHERVLAVLTATDPAQPSWTWWPPNQTAGFWVRRMAQETAVHRVDVELAVGEPTPIDAQLAADGIDEVLTQMLAGDWSDEVQPGSTGTVAVSAAGRRWRVDMYPDRIDVDTGEGDTAAQVSGAPSDVLLWLWGRAEDSALTLSGDRTSAATMRRRLALATQ